MAPRGRPWERDSSGSTRLSLLGDNYVEDGYDYMTGPRDIRNLVRPPFRNTRFETPSPTSSPRGSDFTDESSGSWKGGPAPTERSRSDSEGSRPPLPRHPVPVWQRLPPHSPQRYYGSSPSRSPSPHTRITRLPRTRRQRTGQDPSPSETATEARDESQRAERDPSASGSASKSRGRRQRAVHRNISRTPSRSPRRGFRENRSPSRHDRIYPYYRNNDPTDSELSSADDAYWRRGMAGYAR